ncbi:MAG: pentapeptide repeat-containing protein, partial [Alphaproteobacteria bacterium]|nr:pentapeptide repeat-containing protein [Alphaproteobacteria bacterium]
MERGTIFHARGKRATARRASWTENKRFAPKPSFQTNRLRFGKDPIDVALKAASVPQQIRILQREADRLVVAHERFVRRQPGGRRIVLRFAIMEGLDFSGRALDDADLTGCIMVDCKFDGARLERACLFGADLQRSSFVRASLERADLRGARLKGANLSHANL